MTLYKRGFWDTAWLLSLILISLLVTDSNQSLLRTSLMTRAEKLQKSPNDSAPKFNDFDFFSIMKNIEQISKSEEEGKNQSNNDSKGLNDEQRTSADQNKTSKTNISITFMNTSFREKDPSLDREPLEAVEGNSFMSDQSQKNFTFHEDLEQTGEKQKIKVDSLINPNEVYNSSTNSALLDNNSSTKNIFTKQNHEFSNNQSGFSLETSEVIKDAEKLGFENVEFIKEISPYSKGYLNSIIQDPLRQNSYLIDNNKNYVEDGKIYTAPSFMTEVFNSHITGVITVHDEMLWKQSKTNLELSPYREDPLFKDKKIVVKDMETPIIVPSPKIDFQDELFKKDDEYPKFKQTSYDFLSELIERILEIDDFIMESNENNKKGKITKKTYKNDANKQSYSNIMKYYIENEDTPLQSIFKEKLNDNNSEDDADNLKLDPQALAFERLSKSSAFINNLFLEN